MCAVRASAAAEASGRVTRIGVARFRVLAQGVSVRYGEQAVPDWMCLDAPARLAARADS